MLTCFLRRRRARVMDLQVEWYAGGQILLYGYSPQGNQVLMVELDAETARSLADELQDKAARVLRAEHDLPAGVKRFRVEGLNYG